jgi:hypothetical protein
LTVDLYERHVIFQLQLKLTLQDSGAMGAAETEEQPSSRTFRIGMDE